MRERAGRPGYPYLSDRSEVDRFELAPDDGYGPTVNFDLDDAEAARVDRLVTESITVSLHDHPIRLPLDIRQTPDYMAQGRHVTGINGLLRSGWTAVFDNLSGPLGRVTSHHGWKWGDVVHELGMRQADLEHQERVRVVRTVNDIAAAHETGKVGIIFGLEAATPIENELDRIDVLYGLGVRQMGVVYSESNALGSGLAEASDGGLTAFGRAAVRRMDELGVLIDVSHAGDRTSLEVFAAADSPVLITHAGARAVWRSPRMKPDDVIRACAEQGGLIGIEAAPHSTMSSAHPRHSLESVMDHFRHCVDLVGIDHVAFGPDTLWGDHVGLHDVYGMTAKALPDSVRVAAVKGLEDPTHTPRSLVAWLVAHGYSDDHIHKVMGGNVMRVLSDAWN